MGNKRKLTKTSLNLSSLEHSLLEEIDRLRKENLELRDKLNTAETHVCDI
jgi:hypothetical protein